MIPPGTNGGGRWPRAAADDDLDMNLAPIVGGAVRRAPAAKVVVVVPRVMTVDCVARDDGYDEVVDDDPQEDDEAVERWPPMVSQSQC